MSESPHKLSAPWLRRSSFLSPTMIQSENCSVYETSSFVGHHSVISLREAQGFVFNQDLFASPYQQLQAAARERRLRAASFSGKGHRKELDGGSESRRRHTSHENRRPVMEPEEDDNDTDDVFMEAVEDSEESEELRLSDSDFEEYSEEVDDGDYGGLLEQRYKVTVTDIVVDNDNSIFPE